VQGNARRGVAINTYSFCVLLHSNIKRTWLLFVRTELPSSDENHYCLVRPVLCVFVCVCVCACVRACVHHWPFIAQEVCQMTSLSSENYNARGSRAGSQNHNQKHNEATNCNTEELWFDSRKGQNVCLFPQTSRLAHAPTRLFPKA
jgi:hypothetical protein